MNAIVNRIASGGSVSEAALVGIGLVVAASWMFRKAARIRIQAVLLVLLSVATASVFVYARHPLWPTIVLWAAYYPYLAWVPGKKPAPSDVVPAELNRFNLSAAVSNPLWALAHEDVRMGVHGMVLPLMFVTVCDWAARYAPAFGQDRAAWGLLAMAGFILLLTFNAVVYGVVANRRGWSRISKGYDATRFADEQKRWLVIGLALDVLVVGLAIWRVIWFLRP